MDKTTRAFLTQHPWIKDETLTLPRHRTARWKQRQVDQTEGLVFHQALGGSTALSVARYHTQPNHLAGDGLPSISYTFFVEPDGATILCNDLTEITYSQGDRTRPGDENRMYLSCCFGGDFDGEGHDGLDEPTCYQLTSGLRLWLACKQFFGWSNARLYGHSHFGKPACPGASLGLLIELVQADQDGSATYDFSTVVGRQRALHDLDVYEGKIDGLWGPISRRALRDYQKMTGLVQDGIWSPAVTKRISRDLH